MIGVDVTGRRDSSRTETARTEITALQEQVPPGNPLVSERMSSVREKIDEYDRLDSEPARRDLLQDLEAELADLRDAIDDELADLRDAIDDGRSQAEDLLDDVEAAVSNLRSDSCPRSPTRTTVVEAPSDRFSRTIKNRYYILFC